MSFSLPTAQPSSLSIFLVSSTMSLTSSRFSMRAAPRVSAHAHLERQPVSTQVVLWHGERISRDVTVIGPVRRKVLKPGNITHRLRAATVEVHAIDIRSHKRRCARQFKRHIGAELNYRRRLRASRG